MNRRNLLSCIRFFTRSVSLVCTDAMKKGRKFGFATDSKYAVCFDEKRMEKYFGGFADLS